MRDTMTTTRRQRRAPVVDLTGYTESVERALAAFCQDVSYAVQMSRAARSISRKRQAQEDQPEPSLY